MTNEATDADHAQIKPLVLLVEDEPEILAFLVENLLDDDFEVRTASSIAQARSRLGALDPDVIVLDVGLPDGSGFDLCREIRAADAATVRHDPNVPVVMLSPPMPPRITLSPSPVTMTSAPPVAATVSVVS